MVTTPSEVQVVVDEKYTVETRNSNRCCLSRDAGVVCVSFATGPQLEKMHLIKILFNVVQ